MLLNWMKKFVLIFSITFLLTGCTALTDSNQSKNGLLPAEIVKNIDGDTVTVKVRGKEETIRLLLVDTPETQHPRLGVQPFGPEASDFAKEILYPGRKVEIEPGINYGRDKYGRLLAYIYVDGEMFNERLLEEGLARVAYVYPPNTKYVDVFYDIQDEAKKKEKGIWSIENYSTDEGFQSDKAAQSGYKSGIEGGEAACRGKIKGNKNSMIYHVPEGSYYNSDIKKIEWFCTEKEAKEAGYRKAKR
ncbi:thermonuclease family protein [Bacillus sp. EB01]|uniref:thermonuclease family protein n=1 Tax=Bacillus sp. EB01 TaxID=1347086 RepID=UPI0006945B7F|nr:thermonuclease family protein [Bacillus sp. EB01]